MTYKNKLYGLPFYADIMIFIYNEEMVKKAGISGPPKTWDELIEQCKVMKQKDLCDYPLVFEFSQQEGAANEGLISMIYSRKNGHLFDGLDPVSTNRTRPPSPRRSGSPTPSGPARCATPPP